MSKIFKKMGKGYLLIVFFIFFINLSSAAIISINSGGNDNFIVNPNEYIDRIFYQISSNASVITESPSGDDTIDETEEEEKEKIIPMIWISLLIILFTIFIIVISRNRKRILLFLKRREYDLEVELTK